MARLVLSPNERLLLHLSELDKHMDDPEVPMGASQEGIAQKLGLQVHNASRTLATLEGEGLVSDRLAHVRGAPKRRRAYFLTERGRQAVTTIRSDIMKRRVVLDLEDGAQEVTIEEASRKLAGLVGRAVSFTEVVDAARSSEVLRPDEFRSTRPEPAQAPGKRFAQRSHGRPRVDSFWGREKESASISNALTGDGASVVLIWGMPGIGKSTLASRLFDGLLGKRSVFWYTFTEWDSEATFLPPLAEFLSSDGRGGTLSWFRSGRPVAEVFAPLIHDLTGMEAVFFLDDIQKLAQRHSDLLGLFSEAVRGSRTAKLVLISREIPPFFSKADPSSFAVELGGLERDDAWHMAESLHSPDSVRVVEESKGHPLLIGLMARSGIAKSKGDVVSFIEREVYGAVTEPERRILEVLSTFRHPVPVEAIPGGYDSISKLKQRALVSETEDGISTHDLLREFFRSRMTPPLKVSVNIEAAAYCEAQDEVEWKLEALYHCVQAADWTRAAKIALANAHELAKEYPEETLELISKLPSGLGSSREQSEILFLKGQLLEAAGRQEEALDDFEKSLALLQSDSDSTPRALVLEAVARLHSQIERWTESMAAHEKALKLYERSGDVEGQAREWLNIGGVLRRKGDHGKAREAYTRALTLATKREDRAAQAACMNNLGLLDRDMGRFKDAESRLKESIRLAHAVKDNAGEARGLENLADLLRAQSRGDDMVKLLLQSSEAYRRAGEIEEYKRVVAASAEALGEQGRVADGMQLASKTIETQKSKRRPGLFQRTPRHGPGDIALASILVDLSRASGDLRRSRAELKRFMTIAGSMPDRELAARGRLMEAMVEEDAGNLEAAERLLADAEKILVEIGSSAGLVAIHMRWGNVAEKRGDHESARGHYSEAARHAEIVGDRRALALAMDDLHAVTRGERG